MADIFDNISQNKGDIFDRIQTGSRFDKVKGLGEAALSAGTGMASWIPSGIAKAAGLVSGQLKEGAELGDYIQDKLTYTPKTESGKKYAGYVTAPFEYISEKSQQAGDWAYDKTGSALVGATARTAVEAIPFVVPAGVGKGIKAIKGNIKSLSGMKDVVSETQGKPYSVPPDAKLDIFDKITARDKEVAKPEIVEPAATSGATEAVNPNIGTLEAMVKGGKVGEVPKYAGDSNLNLERLDTTNDVKHFTDGLAKANGIEKTKVSWAETEQLAKDLGWDEKDFLRIAKEKGGFDTAETFAMRQINTNALHDVFNTIKEMPADPLQRTDAMRLQTIDKVNNYLEILKAYTEKTSEAGRSLNIYKKIISENPDFIQNKNREVAFKKMFDTNGGKKLTDDMISDLQKTDFGNPAEVRKVLQKYHKATIKDKIFEAWLNGILSNPTTHAANIIGNALTMLTKVPETVISNVSRGKLPFGEVRAESLGLVQGIKEGAVAAVKSFQSGMPSDMISKIEHSKYNAISGKKGEIIRIPTRALTAADEFFKSIIYRSEVNRLAYLKTIKEGVKGTDKISVRMSEIINDAKRNSDIFAKARNEALYRTFQQPLGHFGNKVMSLRDSVYIMKYIIPFIKTPTNIMKFTLERTPLNYGKIIHDYKKGLIAAEQLSSELAKPTLGSLISAATTLYALDGTITGGAPKNKTERDLLYASGWQPYSIKIGNKYYSYARLEPLGSILGLTADFVNTAKHSDEKTINETASELIMSVTKNLSSKTFLTGISKVLDAISDPEHYGAGYLEQLAGSLIPSGVAAAARSIDPYMREVNTPLESMQARIPVASQNLPFREGAYGKPAENKGGYLNMISPIKVSEETTDKFKAERDLVALRKKRILEKQKRERKKEKSRERRTI